MKIQTAATFVMIASGVVALAASKRLVEGNPESAVRVVAYESLQCGDCAVYRRMLDEKLLPKYGAKVAFEHRDFPLARQVWSRKASIVARYVEEQSPALAVNFRRDILEQRRTVGETGFEQWVSAWAQKNGLDPAKTVAALEDKRLQDIVEKDYQEGVARGVAKTPTVFVNGVPFVETFAFEDIAKAIDEALSQ